MPKHLLFALILLSSFRVLAFKNQPLVGTLNIEDKQHKVDFSEIDIEDLYLNECVDYGNATYSFKNNSIHKNLAISGIGSFKLDYLFLTPRADSWCTVNHFDDGWVKMVFKNAFTHELLTIKYYIFPMDYGVYRYAEVTIDGNIYELLITKSEGRISN